MEEWLLLLVNYLYRTPGVSIKNSLNPSRWLGASVQAAMWADPESLEAQERDGEVQWESGRCPAWCSLPPGGQIWTILLHFRGIQAQATPPKSFCSAPIVQICLWIL